MAIDPRFVVTSDLESLYRDKDSGEPLAGGIITFYSDLNRTTKKPVYQITGSPPNYTYDVLPNPCVLSDVGTFQDALGNNIVPYYFPYQGTPDDNNNTVQLYYITVTDADGVPQFTREGWPNFASSDSATTLDNKNFIPNGQFLAHNTIVSATEPPVSTIAYGSVNLSSQAIAQGGWSFRHSSGGTSVFDNSFERISTAVAGLNDFPRYAFNFACTSFNASDAVRDLTISWPDVNTFSAGDPPGSQDYTFYFSAMSNDSNTYSFNVYLINYFGTGGSPTNPIETLISTVNISPGYSSYTIHITGFPASAGTLGTNDDDYVAISLRGPASSWDVQVTDFALLAGNVSPDAFPVQTQAEMLDEGIAGWMPTPAADGSDLYLPLLLTPSGMTFDTSQIGNVVAKSVDTGFTGSISNTTNELIADGKSYLVSGYSPLGIPYSRLWNTYKVGAPTYLSLHGNGYGFINANSLTGTDELFFFNNTPGQVTSSSGAGVPAFTVSDIFAAIAVAPGFRGYLSAGSAGTAIQTTNGGGAVTGPVDGTGGNLTFSNIQNGTNAPYVFTTTVAVVPTAAQYFRFLSGTYYIWFHVNGAGADPAPGGTGMQINTLSTWASNFIAPMIMATIANKQITYIKVVAAASITAGQYFVFHTTTTNYYAWYRIDNAGTDPAVAASTGIVIDIASGDTANQVREKTLSGLNSFYVGVPDMRGLFLRARDYSSGNDANASTRMSVIPAWSADLIGSLQLSANLSHRHSASAAFFVAGAGFTYDTTAISNFAQITSTTDTGSAQSQPFNTSVVFAIKY